MKNLFLLILILLTVAVLAQPVNQDALLLSAEQLQRVNATQHRIALAQKELEAATEVQNRVIAELRAELGASPAQYDTLTMIDGKPGFPKKKKLPVASQP